MNASKHRHRDIDIVRAYKNGLSCRKIAICLKTSPSAIEYRLAVNGVRLRSRSESLKGRPKSETHKVSLRSKRVGKFKGSDNPNWKGGTSSQEEVTRRSREYELWRNTIFTRDGFTCRSCGFSKGKILHAHHILPRAMNPQLTLAIDNGITLCIPCHRRVHSKGNKHKDGELLGNLKEIISSRAREGIPSKVQRLGAESRTDSNAPTSTVPDKGRYSLSCVATRRSLSLNN